jgi:hypothetical protein
MKQKISRTPEMMLTLLSRPQLIDPGLVGEEFGELVDDAELAELA